MAKQGTLSVQFENRDDTGEAVSKKLCEALVLSGYTQADMSKYIALAAAAADQAVTFTDAVAIILFSHDNPFQLRLAGGETLLSNLRCFVIWCDDTDDEAHSTSVLLTGNGASIANLEAIIIEKP